MSRGFSFAPRCFAAQSVEHWTTTNRLLRLTTPWNNFAIGEDPRTFLSCSTPAPAVAEIAGRLGATETDTSNITRMDIGRILRRKVYIQKTWNAIDDAYRYQTKLDWSARMICSFIGFLWNEFWRFLYVACIYSKDVCYYC